MARGFKTGGRRPGSRNKATLLREAAIREALRAQGDAPDGRELAPLDILRKVANRLYAKAVAARGRGDFPLEEQLLKLAAAAAEKAAPYTSPKMPTMVVSPNALPSIRSMSVAQLRQLLVDLGEDEDTDITDQEAADSDRDRDRSQLLEGPQAPPRGGPPNGSRPRR